MRLNDQRGFTLIELLVGMVIMLLVASSALTMLARSQVASKKIRGRTEASQRGRVAMEQITQRLRAMVCLTSTSPVVTPIVSANSDQITFYTDLDNDVDYDPEMRRLTAVRDTSGALTGIREDRWVGVTVPVAASAASNSSRYLINNLAPLNASTPLFRYYAYSGATAETPAALAIGTVAAADLPRIVRVEVSFLAGTSERLAQGTTPTVSMQSSVYARTVRRDSTTPSFDCTA